MKLGIITQSIKQMRQKLPVRWESLCKHVFIYPLRAANSLKVDVVVLPRSQRRIPESLKRKRHQFSFIPGKPGSSQVLMFIL